MRASLLKMTDRGLYCPPAGIYIDPWKPVKRAVITHAHSDHARPGHRHYLAHHDSAGILRLRLGDISLETLGYDDPVDINGVRISLHPAGHIIGSSQVLLEHRGQRALITGDFKTEDDGLTTPFEPVKADLMVMESTFGLPVYGWPKQEAVMESIREWWLSNQENGYASVLCAYALGKAQRLLKHIDPQIGPIYVHGAVYQVNQVLHETNPGVRIFPRVEKDIPRENYRNALIVTPSSALNTPWMRKFQPYRTAMASGWMNIRGARRRRAVDRGFVLSDHADWDQLNRVVDQAEAREIYITHGYSYEFSKWLRHRGYDAHPLETGFGDTPEDDLTSPST